MSLTSFYTPCKYQKTNGFLFFFRGYRKRPMTCIQLNLQVIIYKLNPFSGNNSIQCKNYSKFLLRRRVQTNELFGRNIHRYQKKKSRKRLSEHKKLTIMKYCNKNPLRKSIFSQVTSLSAAVKKSNPLPTVSEN